MSASDTETSLLHTTDYNIRFDSTAYLKGCYSGIDTDPNEAPFSAFFIQNIVAFLHDSQTRLGNKKALEFGGGPCLWPAFVLAQYVDSIRFCDYAQCNLDAVDDWLKQKPNAFDWSTFFEGVLDVARKPKEDRVEWESRLRDALNKGGLSKCDVNDPDCPVLSGEADTFDIVFSSLCLEAACLTIKKFNETIKRLVRLLKPGGVLLLAMVRNESFYYVGAEKFFCLPLDESKVQQALHDAGDLIDVHIDSSDIIPEDLERNSSSDFDGKMVTRAYKRN